MRDDNICQGFGGERRSYSGGSNYKECIGMVCIVYGNLMEKCRGVVVFTLLRSNVWCEVV